ncbi:MAG: hypothetical protein Q9162_006537 [Coniocarpon cinnabarinum]
MALSAPPNERKRVKVYELRDNDWFDRGTGFCNTQWILERGRIFVESEEDPDHILLESRIKKEDSYQKQQDTLIVWTDNHGVDMALSFQEAEGCGLVCEAIGSVQQRPLDDPDEMPPSPLSLPPPTLSHLNQIEDVMRRANQTQMGRDSMSKMIVNEDYIPRLTSLVSEAEDLESLPDLHRICNIMKMLILFNDTQIIEYVVRDEVVLGVVSALEYDADFPFYKANHRQYLADESKFKEVVPIEDPDIKRKIHFTYRLQYLKDVVLARILDDPTFSVLNSLIFFHQVDIVQHIQGNAAYISKIFGLINDPKSEPQDRKDAVLLIQQSCAIAKNLQAHSRASLYENLINGGLFQTITFAVQHKDAAVRVAGTDILVALIDHSANLTRHHVINATKEGTKPMTETLIELLLVETDLGVKAQIADALKVLLDPNANGPGDDRPMGPEQPFMKTRGNPAMHAQSDGFLHQFYETAANKLFKPLKDLENRTDISSLSVQESTTYVHLIEILSFFMRQHGAQGRVYVLEQNFHERISQLLQHSPEKHLKIHAIKYFRTVVTIGDDFHLRQLVSFNIFKPILDIIIATMPRDNLLNSVCLELFEFIRKENSELLIRHLAETLCDEVTSIKITNVFKGIMLRYDQRMNPPPEGIHGDAAADSSFMTSDLETPNTRHITINGGAQRWQGLREADPDEEAYFNTSDDEDEEDELAADHHMSPSPDGSLGSLGARLSRHVNGLGASPLAKPLVDYEDEEVDEDLTAIAQGDAADSDAHSSPLSNAGLVSSDGSRPSSATSPPSEDQTANAATPARQSRPPSAKRMREEDDEDDELSKLSQGIKRRSSSQNLRAARDHAANHKSSKSRSPQSPESPDGDKDKPEDPDAMDTDEKAAHNSVSTKPTTPLRQSARRKERDSAHSKGGTDSGRSKRISISLSKREKDRDKEKES